MKKRICAAIFASAILLSSVAGCAKDGSENEETTPPIDLGGLSDILVETAQQTPAETEKTNPVDDGKVYSSKGFLIEEIDGVTYVDGVLIANKTYALPKDYTPISQDEVSAALDKMFVAAKGDGVVFWVASGYRTYETQEKLYTNYCNKNGQAAADTYSARPGHSEHQTGLAYDVLSSGYYSLESAWGETTAGKWLAAHCAEYGFIIRYPKGKDSITGYIYEPWHIRYLGVDVATAVYNSGLTLEEYLGVTSSYEDHEALESKKAEETGK